MKAPHKTQDLKMVKLGNLLKQTPGKKSILKKREYVILGKVSSGRQKTNLFKKEGGVHKNEGSLVQAEPCLHAEFLEYDVQAAGRAQTCRASALHGSSGAGLPNSSAGKCRFKSNRFGGVPLTFRKNAH